MYLQPALIILMSVIVICIICMTYYVNKISERIKKLDHSLSDQYALLGKMQLLLRSKYAINSVAENAEIIYQDLLQNIIPILSELEINPRNTTEHPLWKSLGGLMDEYAKNPFVLEKLRRAIKLDANIERTVNSFLTRSDALLKRLGNIEGDNLLLGAFTDGLLGQTVTLLSQAKQLAKS